MWHIYLSTGFHEAIGETIALSVSSPRHLQTLGLIQRSVDDTAHDINYLFTQAMDKLAFLPFALVMDRWRWDVFTGDIRKEQYNCHWWSLRLVADVNISVSFLLYTLKFSRVFTILFVIKSIRITTWLPLFN